MVLYVHLIQVSVKISYMLCFFIYLKKVTHITVIPDALFKRNQKTYNLLSIKR